MSVKLQFARTYGELGHTGQRSATAANLLK
jgi:hypothetical protein